MADSQRFWRLNTITFCVDLLPHQRGLLVGILVPIPRFHIPTILHKLVPVHFKEVLRSFLPIIFSTFSQLCIDLKKTIEATAVSVSVDILDSHHYTSFLPNTQGTLDSSVYRPCSLFFLNHSLFLCTWVERFCLWHGFPVAASASLCIMQ